MLNRTNLTLSALSNRLNLGTRSLVLGTSVKHGNQTLRFRHTFHDVMRERPMWYAVSPVAAGKYDIPVVTDSIITGRLQRPMRCDRSASSLSACRQSASSSIRASYAAGAGSRARAAIAAAAES